MMNSQEFISKLQSIAANYKTVYMWGTFGAPVSEALIVQKTKQYPSWYTASRQALFRSLVGKGYFAFDCVNVIKAVLWGWNGDAGKSYGGATYASNGVPDVSADGMIALCKDVSTNFTGIIPGEAVWMTGHIGVYIGNGKVIECTPVWKNGVQVTALGNIGSISGLNSRTWKKHGKLPYIDYSVKEDEEEMKNIILVSHGVDERAAGYLANFLQCGIVFKGAISTDELAKCENVYEVGGTQSYAKAKKFISGSTRYETCQKVLDFIGGK